jgi:hypothetical protein
MRDATVGALAGVPARAVQQPQRRPRQVVIPPGEQFVPDDLRSYSASVPWSTTVNSPRDWRHSTRRRAPAPRSVSSISML